LQHVFLKVVWCALAVLMAFANGPLRAQVVVPSVVEEMRLVTADDGGATFILRFSPAEPRFATIDRNPTRPELVMATTLKTGRVPDRQSFRGLVRSLLFVTEGSSLVLRFDTARPASIKAEKIGNNSVQVRVEQLPEEETIGSRPLGSTGESVIPQQQLSRVPVDSFAFGDSYEMVFLKYADVSEVVGLLSEGLEIAPNDVFIRREPGFGSPGSGQQSNFISAPPQPDARWLPARWTSILTSCSPIMLRDWRSPASRPPDRPATPAPQPSLAACPCRCPSLSALPTSQPYFSIPEKD